MRLAKVQLARSIWLFDTAELNPHGISVESLKNMVEGFGFKWPKPEEIASGKAELKNGKFVFDGNTIDVNLDIHADGLVADTRHSTEASDEFLSKFIVAVSRDLGVQYSPQMARKRIYRSEMIVYAEDFKLVRVCEKLDAFARELSASIKSTQELSAVVYGESTKVNNFSFERRINESFELNRFYSSALLPTEEHLRMLERFEAILSA